MKLDADYLEASEKEFIGLSEARVAEAITLRRLHLYLLGEHIVPVTWPGQLLSILRARHGDDGGPCMVTVLATLFSLNAFEDTYGRQLVQEVKHYRSPRVTLLCADALLVNGRMHHMSGFQPAAKATGT